MGNLQRPQVQKPRRRSSYGYRCSVCMYSSNRRYNIVRHEYRIHSADSTRPRKCCDVLYKTKGDYYIHCEDKHPDSRPTNITSRQKYKILPRTMRTRSPNNIVTSSPKKTEKMRYMLRSRALSKTRANENVELAESGSSKSSDSSYESDLDDESVKDSPNSKESSGYGTKTSMNSTFKTTEENCEMDFSYSEERNKWDDKQLHCDEVASEAVEESVEPSAIEFCQDEQPTAGYGESSLPELQKTFDELSLIVPGQIKSARNESSGEFLDLTTSSVYPEKSDSKESDAVESEDMRSTSENELKQNCYSGTPNLPPKKRILQSLRFANHENIANMRNSMADRPARQLNAKSTPLRKKHRLSKKIKRRNSRKAINLLAYSSASSDTENASPLSAATRTQKSPGVIVDLRADGSFTWEEATRLMRERLMFIDFDRLPAIPR